MSRKSFCYKTLETYDKPRDQLKSFCRDGGNSGYYNISSTRGICNDDGISHKKKPWYSIIQDFALKKNLTEKLPPSFPQPHTTEALYYYLEFKKHLPTPQSPITGCLNGQRITILLVD